MNYDIRGSFALKSRLPIAMVARDVLVRGAAEINFANLLEAPGALTGSTRTTVYLSQ